MLQQGDTRQAIRAALTGTFTDSAVNRSLDRLMAAGLVVERQREYDSDESGFWELAGLDSDAASIATRSRSVQAVAVGGAGTEEFTGAAMAQGLRVVSADAELTVVLTDDFLNPDILRFNDLALASKKPWVVARLTGESSWIGPVLDPGDSACWACIVQRTRGHRQIESAILRMAGQEYSRISGKVELATTVGLAAHLAVLRVAQWVAGVRDDHPYVLSFDALTLESRKHRVSRRPQCPTCGDATMQALAAQQPLTLQRRSMGSSTDGGYRVLSQEKMLATYGHLFSPITGIVSELTKMETGSDLLHVYTAGHNFAMSRPRELSRIRRGLRTESAGKGMSDRQARASALGEAIERYSGVWQGDEACVLSSFRALGADAVHLDTLQHFSEEQFQHRESWRARKRSFEWVPDPFDETQEISWTPVWSMSEDRHKYVPTSYLYYDFPVPPGPIYARANSNGNAAGSSREDAILQGFFELVERDSVAMWWYNRVRRPAIALDQFVDPYFSRWQEHYDSVGRQAWVLDLTSDLGIPVAAAISRQPDGPTEDILFGFGAHFDPAIAVSRALTEMNQFLAGLMEFRAEGESSAPDEAWWKIASLESQPYLAPEGVSELSAHALPHRQGGSDLLSDVLAVRRIVEERGMEMLVLDQTRPDIGLPVVKVMVPGLRSMWPQYAPGRVFDVPVTLGWTESATREADVNPVAMFL